MRADNHGRARGHFNQTLLAARRSNSRPTWRDTSELGWISLRAASERLPPRLQLRHFNGAVRRQRRQPAHWCVHHHLSHRRRSVPGRRRRLYSHACFFECLKECFAPIIIPGSFSDAHTWSWNINQEGVFPFILSLSSLQKTPGVFLWKAQRRSRSL